MKKKTLLLLLLTFSLFAATQANAQGVKFGMKAGLNVTDMHFSKKVLDKSNQAGWFFGPTVKFSLPLVGLGVDVSALYDYRSAKVELEQGEEKTVKHQQIAIPINLRYSVGLGSTANIFFFAGPQWGINVGNKEFKWAKGSSYSLKKSDFSMNLGLGATVLNHVQVTANYNVACGKSSDVTVSDALNALVKNKSRNNSWQIGVAYFF